MLLAHCMAIQRRPEGSLLALFTFKLEYMHLNSLALFNFRLFPPCSFSRMYSVSKFDQKKRLKYEVPDLEIVTCKVCNFLFTKILKGTNIARCIRKLFFLNALTFPRTPPLPHTQKKKRKKNKAQSIVCNQGL